MKKKIFNIICALFAGVALFMAVSCGNITDSSESVEQKDSPVIRVALADSSRTVLPDYNYSEFSFVLKVYNDNSWVELGSYDSASALTDATINLGSAGLAVGETCSFELVATKDNISCKASCSRTLTAGENLLEMKLYASSLGNENGTLAYTVDFSAAPNVASVKSVSVVCKKVNDNSETFSRTYITGDETLPIPENKKIVLSEELAPGSYELAVTLYAEDNVKLLRWDERVIIAEELSSSKTLELNSLNSVYTVTFNPNYTGSTAIVKKASRFDSFNDIAPTLNRPGYIFSGWYTESECQNSIDVCNITGNLTVYAKWEAATNADGSYNITGDSAQSVLTMLEEISPQVVFNLKVVDSSSNYGNICTELKKHPNVIVSIDFSGATQFTSMNSDTFASCSNIKSLILPAGLRGYSSDWAPFSGCTSLESISFAGENSNYTVGEDGALYDKNKNWLYAYPPAKTVSTYALPKTVTEIKLGVFKGCVNISAFEVESGNTSFKTVDGVLYSADGKTLVAYPASKTNSSFVIPENTVKTMPYAFANCPNLTQITFADTEYEFRYDSSNYSSVIESKNASSLSEDTDLTDFIKTNSVYYFYNSNLARQNFETASVFTTESFSVNNETYTIADISSGEYKWYKVTTEEGKAYRVNWVDGYNYYNVSNNYSVESQYLSSFKDYCIYIYSDSPYELTNTNDSPTLTFTAVGTTTYIKVGGSSNTGKCAFRVIDAEAAENAPNTLAAVVTVVQNDIDVSMSDNGSYIYFDIPSSWTSSSWSSKWYVDGNEIDSYQDCGSYDFYPSNYTRGTHLVTLEFQKGGEYYSYSAQVKVQ